jgi:hypothetical protein
MLALLHRASCASISRTAQEALCASLALRLLPLRALDASSYPLVLSHLSHRIPDVQDPMSLLICSGCQLSTAQLRHALCASDAGEGGLGFGVLALTDLKSDTVRIFS